MSDRLHETCEREFERYAEMLFDGVARENAFAACTPECLDRLQDLLVRAERATMWFARHAPEWCQPLPLIYYDEQENILCSGDFPRHLTVYYANSLRGLSFDYLQHPLFFDYARGVMAHPECPDYLQGDRQLLAEFPPKPLPGLGSEMMWHAKQALALPTDAEVQEMHRQMQAMMAMMHKAHPTRM
jgi:hypothetical protein